MAQLFLKQVRFDDANAHIQRAKLHAIDNRASYTLAHATEMQAQVWRGKRRFEEAKSEALRAVDAFEKLGAVEDAKRVRELLLRIDREARVKGRS